MATIDQRGSKWRAQVRKRGMKPICKSFGTKQEAKDWAERTEGLAVNDLLPITYKTTLSEAILRYQREITPTKKGQEAEGYIIKFWLDNELAKYPLSSITPSHLTPIRDKMISKGRAPSTIMNKLFFLSHVYKVAATDWNLTHLNNPVSNVRMPKSNPARERRLEGDEYERLLAACEADCNRWMAPAFILAVETGMRQAELTHFLWQHVDLDKRTIRLPASLTKTSKSRIIPLSTKAVDTLKSLDEGNPGDIVLPLIKATVGKAWTRIRGVAGVVGLTWHDLRAAACTRMLDKGLNPYQVCAISGHSSTTMLGVYARYSAESLVDLLG